MKKLLAGLMIGSLFSLGCGTDTTTKGTPPKGGTPPKPPMTRPGAEKDESKPEPKKDEDKTEPKKDDSKKNAPKKDSN